VTGAILLPWKRGAGVYLTSEPTRSAVPLPTALRRLLIVDDDAALRENLAEVFVAHDFDVLEAESGCGALEILARGVRPDVVLLDYRLPDLNGGDVFHRMTSEAPAPPTILMTADARAAQLAAQHGIPHSLRKPFDTASLVTLVSALATRSES
jgi:CheY-like chemotaxis protein